MLRDMLDHDHCDACGMDLYLLIENYTIDDDNDRLYCPPCAKALGVDGNVESIDPVRGFIIDVTSEALTWLQYHPKSTLIEAYGISFDKLTRDSL